MTPFDSPFQLGWMGIDLPGARQCDGTYCFYPYDQLPPVDETLLTGKFSWLTQLDDRQATIVEIHKQTPQTQLSLALTQLQATAQTLGLTLPPAFVAFLGSPTLPDQIPSSTACYFDLPEQIAKYPSGDGYFVRFLNDQQDVLLWYLYLLPNGEHGVVVSPIPFDTEPLEQIDPQVLKSNTAFCASSFEAFIYRYWLENTLWFALEEDPAKLTPAQQAYLAHYRGRQA